MASCMGSDFIDFVSDCADIACAAELKANAFLAAIGGGSRGFFSADLVGSVTKCGSVDLSTWLLDSSQAAAAAEGIGGSLMRLVEHATPMTATAATSQASTTKNGFRLSWRPTTLAVLCCVLLVFLVVDAILLVFVQRKWRLLRKLRRESDYAAT